MKDIQELHYVYYAIQKDGTPKVGATQNLKQRIRQSKYQELILLEVYDCPWKCGDREWQLQELYFGKRDSNTHYAITYKIKKVKGEKHGHTSLITKQVLEIRDIYNKHIKGNKDYTKPHNKFTLAKKYNVSPGCIRDICEYKTWKHINP